ncbi:nucleoside hydrolase [Terrabacter sp. GCM10028922]|uniref:nucleoside hydrolase n=1 Tax=Terrabacter sp. GCM10028922 TaxID=3273428 RepID=UPI0036179E43
MPTELILDCDTGVDDALAILYAAGQGARVHACTVTHGNVPVEVGTRNTLTVLDLAGLSTVPVHAGASRPMAQPLQTSEHVHGRDGLGDAGVSTSSRQPAGDLAAVEIVRLARERPGKLTLVAVGPLTNIGLALLLEPDLPALVRGVVIMGGAVGVPGNASQLGEANVWHDPEAAQLVVDSRWDVLFVGLETTMQAPIPPEALRRIEASTDPRARFTWAIMQHYMDLYEPTLGLRSCIPHDALAVALALDPDLATYRCIEAYVETGPGRTRGTLVGDLRPFAPPPAEPSTRGVIRIVDRMDFNTFFARLLESLGA